MKGNIFSSPFHQQVQKNMFPERKKIIGKRITIPQHVDMGLRVRVNRIGTLANVWRVRNQEIIVVP